MSCAYTSHNRIGPVHYRGSSDRRANPWVSRRGSKEQQASHRAPQCRTGALVDMEKHDGAFVPSREFPSQHSPVSTAPTTAPSNKISRNVETDRISPLSPSIPAPCSRSFRRSFRHQNVRLKAQQCPPISDAVQRSFRRMARRDEAHASSVEFLVHKGIHRRR